MKLMPWLICICTVVLLTACYVPAQTHPEQIPPEVRFFPETGFSVQGEFLHFFERYGGVDSLGYPISEEFEESGWQVQYFEYGRLEFHPENQPDYQITVGWLGDLLNRRRPPLPLSSLPPVDDVNRRYFPTTGHTLSGDFLRYFEANGGSVRFGLPISEPFFQHGYLTQDLQSARFFWSPTATPPVQLEVIGHTHLLLVNKNKAH